MEVKPARLAQASRPRLPESGRDRYDGRVRLVADDLELVALADRRLVDVAGEDEICSRVDECAQHVVTSGDRPLVCRPPRRADQMVVEDGDAEGSLLGGGEPFRCALQLGSAQCAALLAEGPRRVEPDDMEPRRPRCARSPEATTS